MYVENLYKLNNYGGNSIQYNNGNSNNTCNL